jgi:hypothetical protein
MRHRFVISLLLVFTYVISACGSNATPAASVSTIPVAAEDQASLVAALKAAGVNVETGDPITQDFFSVGGQTIKVNGADLQVFEYENAQAMEADASKVASDGGSIGTSMVDWIDMPHFYKAGRMIVLYVGSDQTILNLLNKIIGPQFAGR